MVCIHNYKSYMVDLVRLWVKLNRNRYPKYHNMKPDGLFAESATSLITLISGLGLGLGFGFHARAYLFLPQSYIEWRFTVCILRIKLHHILFNRWKKPTSFKLLVSPLHTNGELTIFYLFPPVFNLFWFSWFKIKC